jgi:hypothetical protein
MNEYPQISTNNSFGPEGEEDLAIELWRLWISELKPHFEAEKDFLVKYGKDNGYDPDYVARVLEDQKKMEELVWEKEGMSVGRFARTLSAHIRFKNDFFVSRVRNILELEGPASRGEAVS